MTRSAVEKEKRPLNSKVIPTSHLFTFVLKYSSWIKAQTIKHLELILKFYFPEEELLPKQTVKK